MKKGKKVRQLCPVLLLYPVNEAEDCPVDAEMQWWRTTLNNVVVLELNGVGTKIQLSVHLYKVQM